MKTYYFLIMVILFIALPFPSKAQIPRTLSYQGVLSDTSGVPKPDGSYTLTFRLYLASSGGSAIWTETKTLNVKNGLFNTILADQTPFDTLVTFDKPYWLGIKVGTEPELLPRIPLTSVAYSLNSTNDAGFSHYMIYYSSGTFIVRGGVSKIMAEMWGAGGGGGGARLEIDSLGLKIMDIGGGGGGGGYAKQIFDCTPGTNYTVIVGQGGSGGSPCEIRTCTAGSGSDGGTTSFGGISVTGGKGGDGGCFQCPGVGGRGGKQDMGIAFIRVSGGDGGWLKNGGFGGGTGGGGCSTNIMGGKEPGGGGASCDSGGYGWAGANGIVIVWW